jgi:mRNA interferase RelE/StbE
VTYKLAFLPSARKEWDGLGGNVREQFRKKLIERLEAPRLASAKLSGMPDCYKIKLRPAGYRLVYRVDDDVVTVVVVAVGRPDRNLVYKIAAGRAGARAGEGATAAGRGDQRFFGTNNGRFPTRSQTTAANAAEPVSKGTMVGKPKRGAETATHVAR